MMISGIFALIGFGLVLICLLIILRFTTFFLATFTTDFLRGVIAFFVTAFAFADVVIFFLAATFFGADFL
ncbi:MAG: hypothetical protein AB8B83_05925, partial [Bdellovibrionales bacterium]